MLEKLSDGCMNFISGLGLRVRFNGFSIRPIAWLTVDLPNLQDTQVEKYEEWHRHQDLLMCVALHQIQPSRLSLLNQYSQIQSVSDQHILRMKIPRNHSSQTSSLRQSSNSFKVYIDTPPTHSPVSSVSIF